MDEVIKWTAATLLRLSFTVFRVFWGLFGLITLYYGVVLFAYFYGGAVDFVVLALFSWLSISFLWPVRIIAAILALVAAGLVVRWHPWCQKWWGWWFDLWLGKDRPLERAQLMIGTLGPLTAFLQVWGYLKTERMKLVVFLFIGVSIIATTLLTSPPMPSFHDEIGDY